MQTVRPLVLRALQGTPEAGCAGEDGEVITNNTSEAGDAFVTLTTERNPVTLDQFAEQVYEIRLRQIMECEERPSWHER